MKTGRVGQSGDDQIEGLGLPVFATINYAAGADTERSKRADRQPTLGADRPWRYRGRGLSRVAHQPATVMAQGGPRKFFNQAKNAPSLAEYLSEKSSLEQVLLKGPVEGLSFIATGRYPPNTADLLLRPRIAELLGLLDRKYDMIVIDAPPVLAVTDPVLLGTIAGAILMVARHEVTQLGDIVATKTALKSAAGLKITGTVRNSFDPRIAAGNRYSYRYYYKRTAY